MSLSLLFFRPLSDPPLRDADIVAALDSEAGMAIAGQAADAYRPFEWHHPATGSWLSGDIGDPPLEDADDYRPKSYPGWTPIGLSLHLPLSAPHWNCVECSRLVERLLQRLPGVQVLNTEDTQRSDQPEEQGPGPLDRQRLLACWEQLHLAQQETRNQTPRMARRSSIALWRYRSERAMGQAEHSDLRWPDALVLSDGPRAHSAVIWPASPAGWALPPVELLVLPDEHPPQVHPITALLDQITDDDLGYGGAIRIPDHELASQLGRRGSQLPLDRFRAVGEGEWID